MLLNSRVCDVSTSWSWIKIFVMYNNITGPPRGLGLQIFTTCFILDYSLVVLFYQHSIFENWENTILAILLTKSRDFLLLFHFDKHSNDFEHYLMMIHIISS